MKIGTWGFLELLITNPDSTIRNKKWRIQYGRPTCKKLLDWDENWCSGVFGVVDYESKIKIQLFKISDTIWQIKMQKAKSYAAKVFLRQTCFRWSVLHPNVCMGVFCVTDYESDLRFLKFNMADPRWRPEIWSYSIILKICIQRFIELPITKLIQNFKVSIQRI